jgi:hypothetical protein
VDGASTNGAPLETRYTSAAPVRGKSIGHTSVVFKVKLDGDLDAAFKPRSKRGGKRYAGEIAAYRLARTLGLLNVPAAFPRSFDAMEFRRVLGGGATSGAGALFDAEVISESDGQIRGAIIPWLTRFELLPLESPVWRARTRAWLNDATQINNADRAMAGQISTMIGFDYLTANWDRWSGGNVAIDRTTNTILFIDNDGAFFEPPPPVATATQLARVRETFRFSRSFVAALRGLDEATVASSLGIEFETTQLLAPKARAAVSRRCVELLQIIDEKIRAASEGNVLAFD